MDVQLKKSSVQIKTCTRTCEHTDSYVQYYMKCIYKATNFICDVQFEQCYISYNKKFKYIFRVSKRNSKVVCPMHIQSIHFHYIGNISKCF